MKLFTCDGGRARAVFLFILLGLVFGGGPFGSDAYAKSESSRLTDQMKTQFDAAVTNSDVNKAKEIWSSIDMAFSDKFDRRMAKGVIFSGGFVGGKAFQKLHESKNSEFEQLALFFSSINQSFLTSPPAYETTGSLTGTITDSETRQKLAGVKVMFAGQETITNSKGEYAFRDIPVGIYNLYWFSSGSKVGENPSVMVEENVSTKYSLSLRMKDGPSLAELKKRNDAALAKSVKEANDAIDTALAARKSLVGKEILVGTLLDEDSGAPIAKATVMMSCKPNASPSQPQASSGAMIKNVTSDEKGQFTITEIPEGICDMSIMKTNVSFSNMLEKVNSHEDRTYGFTQKFRMTANTTHRLEHTWKIAAKTLDTGGTLTGVVLNADDKTPVVGALVSVASGHVGLVAVNGKSAKTDKQGRFEIRFVPAGDQTIEVGKEIFKPNSQGVKILKGKRVDVTLKLEPITTGTVTGLALNTEDQQPLVGVKINLGTLSATTDAQGRFELHDVDAGDVTVRGSKEIFKPALQSVVLQPAKSVDVTLKLEPITTGTVTGLALNAADQQPLAGVNITLGMLSATTDAQGRFKLDDVHAGDVKVEGSKEVFKPAAQGVKVLAAKRVDVTLKLEPITTGTVTGLALNAADQKPLAGVKVTLGTLSTTTDAQGRFKLLNVHAGDVLVSGNKAVFKPASQGMKLQAAKSVNVTLKLVPIMVGTVTGLVLNAADQKPLAGATITAGSKSVTTDIQGKFTLSDMGTGPLSVQAGKSIFKPASQGVQVVAAKSVNVTLKLEPITVGTVTGIALNAADQKPLSGVKVTLGTLSTTTDMQGRFKLLNVHAGDVLVRGNKAVFKSGSQGVQVQAAKSVDVTLKLAPITVGTLTGLVLNAVDQKPVAGATITAGARTATTDAQGKFTLSDMAAGPLSVQAGKPVFKPGSAGIEVVAAQSVSVTLKLKPITTGTVTGLALNAANQKPLAGVKVILGTFSTATDAQGRFKLLNVHAGDVLVSGNKTVFKPASQGVQVVAAKSVDVTLKLEPITTATIKGLAVDKQTGKPIAGVRVAASNKDDETDVKGVFGLDNVAAGKISLVARHADYKTVERRIKLKAGEVHKQKLELERRREDVLELEAALRDKGTVDLYGIHFDSGKNQFLSSSLSTLQAVSEVIKGMPDNVFEVSGHTDSDGQEGYNQGLSERRSRIVIKWLVEHGVNAKQLKPKGYGESKPVVSNSSEAGKALNRRVQLKVKL